MDSLDPAPQIRRDQEIDGWNVRIYFWSRSPWVLFGIACAILACGASLAWQFRAPEALRQERDAAELPTLLALLAQPAPDPAAVLAALEDGRLSPAGTNATEPLQAIHASALEEPMKQVAVACWESLQAGEPSADLLWHAHAPQPLPLANEVLGDFHRADKRLKQACIYYLREVRSSGADSARRKHIELLVGKNDLAALARLAGDPLYAAHLSPRVQLVLALHERRWSDVARTLLALERELYPPVAALLALAAGITWMIVALQAIQPPGAWSFRFVAPWVALAFGLASSWVSGFAGLWQEEMLGLTARDSGELSHILLFFVFGAAPRDEVIKLLFFLPFLPFALSRKSRLEMLLLGGCVGLGFAARESLLFFRDSGAEIGFGRFLTAPFFHLSATGVSALALCELLSAPRQKASAFCGILFTVILAHGFYDAFMAVPRFPFLVVVSMIAFLLISLSFIDQLRAVRDHLTDQVSIVATLVTGISVLSCLMFVCASANLGFSIGMFALGTNALGLAAVVLMIYWHLGGLQARLRCDTSSSTDSVWTPPSLSH